LFLAKAGESQNLEYKGDIISDENRNDLVETVIAFSNTNNGIILIGVANDGQIIGSSRNPDDISKVIHDSCDPPPQNVKIEERNVSGNRVIIVEVPKGDDPPYQSKRDKNWYVRHSANDMRMERSELIRMLNDVRAKL
jgi:ATP-dependent DNA helicase RecG